jgi:hypothetical protein
MSNRRRPHQMLPLHTINVARNVARFVFPPSSVTSQMTITKSDHEIAVRTSSSNFLAPNSEHAIVVAIFALDIVLIAAVTSAAIFREDDGALESSADVIYPFPVAVASVGLLPLLLMCSGVYCSASAHRS